MNNFVAVFGVNVFYKIQQEIVTYIWLIILLNLCWIKSKDYQRTTNTVVGIKVNLAQFMARILIDKFEKVVNATTKVMNQKAVNFINI